MGKIRAALVVAGFVLVVTVWLVIGDTVSWLMSGVLPH
jgi:hypothetical protein